MSVNRKHKWTLTLFILISALGFVFGCADKSKTPTAPAAIDFITNYDTALAVAQQKNQNILLDFYTDWCRWCKTLDTVTYIDSAVIELSKSVVFVKLDAEVDSNLAKQYSVTGFPTILFLNSDGTEIDRIGGFLPPAEFIETVGNYSHDRETLNDYLRRADTNATSEVNFILGEKLSSRGEFDKAIDYYGKVVKADPKMQDTLTAGAMISIGGNYVQKKEYDKAIAQFKSIIKSSKDDVVTGDANFWLSYVYTKKADTTTAIKILEDFLKKYPNHPDTTYAQNRIEKLKNPPPPDESK